MTARRGGQQPISARLGVFGAWLDGVLALQEVSEALPVLSVALFRPLRGAPAWEVALGGRQHFRPRVQGGGVQGVGADETNEILGVVRPGGGGRGRWGS